MSKSPSLSTHSLYHRYSGDPNPVPILRGSGRAPGGHDSLTVFQRPAGSPCASVPPKLFYTGVGLGTRPLTRECTGSNTPPSLEYDLRTLANDGILDEIKCRRVVCLPSTAWTPETGSPLPSISVLPVHHFSPGNTSAKRHGASFYFVLPRLSTSHPRHRMFSTSFLQCNLPLRPLPQSSCKDLRRKGRPSVVLAPAPRSLPSTKARGGG